MIALDTCVLARYVTEDDKLQTPVAQRRVQAGGFLPLTVLLELVWLLRSHYRYTRAMVADTLEDLLELPLISVSDPSGLLWAANRIRAGADPADIFHLLMSRGYDAFATFDDMARKVGPDSPVPIELLKP